MLQRRTMLISHRTADIFQRMKDKESSKVIVRYEFKHSVNETWYFSLRSWSSNFAAQGWPEEIQTRGGALNEESKDNILSAAHKFKLKILSVKYVRQSSVIIEMEKQ